LGFGGEEGRGKEQVMSTGQSEGAGRGGRGKRGGSAYNVSASYLLTRKKGPLIVVQENSHLRRGDEGVVSGTWVNMNYDETNDSRRM